MNAKQRKTLAAVFERPTRADVRWGDVESLFAVLGAEISEGAGSRVRVKLHGKYAGFHRPHPGRIAGKAAVESVRLFLKRAGVTP
ncbi:MAG: type II toxin-antitoxin system HicA family toxin [Candidatus Hydrogenedentota bacterium]